MKLLVVLLSLFFILHASAHPAHAQTTIWSGNCVGSITDTQDVATLQGIECLLGNVLVVALRLIGIVMFLMLLVGGVRYLTSGGDPKAIEGAQQTITLALTGLVMAILSWFILAIIAEFTGITALTTFTFPDFN
jgi:hypothetical protein